MFQFGQPPTPGMSLRTGRRNYADGRFGPSRRFAIIVRLMLEELGQFHMRVNVAVVCGLLPQVHRRR